MTDIPTSANLEDHLVLAQRVELLVGTAVDGTTTPDKFTTMRELELDIVHPETRINHGLKRTYGHGSPDIKVRFKLSVTEEILPYLRIRGLRSTGGVIPRYAYAMKVTPNDGAAKTITVRGKLTEKRYTKTDGQDQPTDVECVIRVTDDAEPTT